MAIITIVFAAVLPQFRVILNGWDYRQANTEVIQNGRVLIDHINRNLSKAVRITSVSSPSETNGYIQFIADVNDSNTYRYDISASNYIQYGSVGSLSDLAGPVSSLIFTCYDACDIATTDVNDIRYVEAETTVINSVSTSQNKTFATSVYLRTNAYNGGIVGCWKLDETSGIVAADSSGKGNHGTLVNMNPATDWISGQISGALNFDGLDDYVNCGNDSSLDITDQITIACWVKTNDCNNNQDNPYIGKGDQTYAIRHKPNNVIEFFICDGVRYTTSYPVDSSFNNQWHHLAGTYDGSQLKLYVDGVLQDTANHIGSIDTGTYDFEIGRNSEVTNRLYEGAIDDVRVYSRALDATEIATLANILNYMGATEAKQSSDTTSIVVSTPDTNVGDLLIAAVATDGGSTPFTVSGDWTPIDCTAYGTAVTLGTWWKTASASEPASYNFSWTGDQKAYGWIMRFTGQDTTSPINGTPVSVNQDDSSTPVSPAVTTTIPNCLILRLGAFDNSDVNTLPEPGNPGLIGHTVITMDASGGSGGGEAATIGTWVQGTTHAKEAGTNRALVFVAHAYRSGNLTLNSVTYGGQSMTPVIEASHSSGNPRMFTAAFILDEAGINAAAGSPPTFSPSWGQTPSGVTYSSVFLQNVNQATLTGATAGNTTTSGSSISTSALATSSGDMVIESATSENTGTYTVTAGWSKDVDFSVTGYDGMDGHKSATGANETPSVSQSNGKHALIGFVVKGGVGGTVSGGAGYIKQVSAGSSGQSNFQLTASNAARMLTIAIAPAGNGSYDCCGDYLQP